MKKFLHAAVRLLSGLLLGILVLEAVFRSNTTLLPHGIAAPLPVDPPLTDRWYEVRYADADIFYWQAEIVRPPAEDQLEALVHWRTDAFGFPNPAPVPATVDLVVLGRSYAMGAQTAEAWPSLLRDRYGYRVLNLSQTGAGLAEKQDFLERFGLPRNPRYAVIDVLPPIDIAAFRPAACVAVFHLTAAGWIFFRSESLTAAGRFIGGLFAGGQWFLLPECLLPVAAAAAAVWAVDGPAGDRPSSGRGFTRAVLAIAAAAAVAAIWLVQWATGGGGQPFLYGNF